MVLVSLFLVPITWNSHRSGRDTSINVLCVILKETEKPEREVDVAPCGQEMGS